MLTDKPLCVHVKVSVITVNFNGSKFLTDFFKSLSNQTFKDFEVIFVDNNSTDDSLELLAKMLASQSMEELEVRIVKNPRNLGYCGGNNIALKYANGDYIIFLNNDTYVSPTWLEELVKVMHIDQFIGACQSRHIQAQTDKIQTDGWVLDKYGWSQQLIFHKDKPSVSKAPFFVSGASMIVRKSALNRIRGFDSKLFYGDFDLCWRLKLLGYDMAVALQSIVYHYGGVATKMIVTPPEIVYNHDREILRVLLKNYSTINVIRRTPLSVIIMIVEATFMSFKYRSPFFLANFLRALKWNFRNFKDTLVARYQTQNDRKISDSEIERRMVNYPILLTRRTEVHL